MVPGSGLWTRDGRLARAASEHSGPVRRTGAALNIYDEPKIDCHSHVFDPKRFPFAADTPYVPSGQELGDAGKLLQVFDAYGVRHALLVGPNSGYGTDNRCLLDAIAHSGGRFRGMAVVPNDVSRSDLERLKDAGVRGITFNATVLGVDYYEHSEDLLAALTELDMFVDIQGERGQLSLLAPLVARSGARILIDHCGRPDPDEGFDQPAFQAVLALARTGRSYVKLSGYVKFSHEPYPYRDTWPYVRALIDAFGSDACLWGSDWPFLRAPERVDYGPLLSLVEQLVPDPGDRRKLLWETPRALFGFSA
jgi:predicted TIM-barrel fold metal-dependent hydrolase